MTGIVYKNAPQKVFHSWVEVYHENQWYELEGYILDIMYLRKLQNKNKKCTGTFCGYGVAVKDFQNPTIDFNRNNTYIQSEGITQDFGIYDSPDDLLQVHHQEMSAVKAFMYKHLGRHLMNRNVKKSETCNLFRNRKKKIFIRKNVRHLEWKILRFSGDSGAWRFRLKSQN